MFNALNLIGEKISGESATMQYAPTHKENLMSSPKANDNINHVASSP